MAAMPSCIRVKQPMLAPKRAFSSDGDHDSDGKAGRTDDNARKDHGHRDGQDKGEVIHA